MIIGITGGICSGKSFIMKHINKLGYKVFYADKIADKLMLKNQINYQKIVNNFGESFLLEDKEIDKQKLSKLIFSNEQKRKLLINITCPNIINELKKIIKNHKKVFLEIPLLFELKLEKLFDFILFVYCSENIQIKRLVKRYKISKKESFKRIIKKITIDKQKYFSNYFINTNSNKQYTKEQVNFFLKMIKI